MKSAGIFTLFFWFFISSTLFPASGKYAYDDKDPKSIVTAASRMLLNADFEEMLNITEMVERSRTLQTVESIMSNASLRDSLAKESDKILGFELLGIEYVTNDTTNKLAVVFTKWLVKLETSNPKNPKSFTPIIPLKDPETRRKKRNESIVYVDYLLKLFSGKWKIVSKRTR